MIGVNVRRHRLLGLIIAGFLPQEFRHALRGRGHLPLFPDLLFWTFPWRQPSWPSWGAG